MDIYNYRLLQIRRQQTQAYWQCCRCSTPSLSLTNMHDLPFLLVNKNNTPADCKRLTCMERRWHTN